jgi:hypothetical protein
MIALQIKAMTQAIDLGSRAFERMRELILFGGEQFWPQTSLERSASTAGDAAQGTQIL